MANRNIIETIKTLEIEIDRDQHLLNRKKDALEALRLILPDRVKLSNDYAVNADVQIYSLFEKKIIRRAVRRSQIQQIFTEEYNSLKNVGAGLPKLKREGKLVLVTYNGKKGDSYWGLPAWTEGNDFKEQFKPQLSLLPKKIFKSEISHNEK